MDRLYIRVTTKEKRHIHAHAAGNGMTVSQLGLMALQKEIPGFVIEVRDYRRFSLYHFNYKSYRETLRQKNGKTDEQRVQGTRV